MPLSPAGLTFMADGVLPELPSAVSSWRYLCPCRSRLALQARPHRPRLRSPLEEPLRRHRLPLLAKRPAPLRRAPVLARHRAPALARRQHRALQLAPSPPSPRPLAAVGRPDSRTPCCSASACWRSWPELGASSTEEES